MTEMPSDLRDRVAPLFSPLLHIEPIAADTEDMTAHAAIFTSSNGVRFGPDGAGRLAYCVGDATTAAANGRGWKARNAGQDADALVATMEAERRTNRLVHLRGCNTRGNVAGRLRAMGHQVDERVVYDQVAQTLNEAAQTALAQDDVTIVPLFSPRTAVQFAKQVQGTTCLHVIALSAAVAEAARPMLVQEIAEQPDAPAMYRAIRRAVLRLEGHEGAR